MNFRYFGKVPLCNHRADRGIFIHGFCLPLCSRCTGLLIGAAAGEVLLHAQRKGKYSAANIAAGAGMLVPTAVDGAAEYIAGKESTNRRRFVTGLIAGAGCALIEDGMIRMLRQRSHG